MADPTAIAAQILIRAVDLDKENRLTEALVCYQEGIHILLETIKKMGADKGKEKETLRKRTEDYMRRGEELKKKLEELKKTGNYREQIQIKEDSVGFSYTSVFSRFLDEWVTFVEIDDPFIRAPHQCDNFVRFLELCLKHCPNLKNVKLTTGKDTNGAEDQLKRLAIIRDSINIPRRRTKIKMEVLFSESLHDREIRMDNGWVIKIGRGLDYFKPLERFQIGFTDFDFRQCRSTTIDIFHRKELQAKK